jgi:hypothetical protein
MKGQLESMNWYTCDLTSIHAHLTLLSKDGANVIVNDFALCERAYRSDIIRRYDDVELGRLSRIQDVGGELFDLSLEAGSVLQTKELEAAVVDLLIVSWNNRRKDRGHEQRGGKNVLHLGRWG